MKKIILTQLTLALILAAPGFSRAADQDARSAFHEAAKAGDLAFLEKSLAQGQTINAPDSQGYTALILAAYYGREKAVNLLLAKGADACAKDKRGNTAALGAIFKGHFAIARSLIGSKCGVNDRNHEGQTPLMFAALFDRRGIAKELLLRGADPRLSDAQGFSAISLAEGQGNGEMKALLEKR